MRLVQAGTILLFAPITGHVAYLISLNALKYEWRDVSCAKRPHSARSPGQVLLAGLHP
jgi:hypothetical protein